MKVNFYQDINKVINSTVKSYKFYFSLLPLVLYKNKNSINLIKELLKLQSKSISKERIFCLNDLKQSIVDKNLYSNSEIIIDRENKILKSKLKTNLLFDLFNIKVKQDFRVINLAGLSNITSEAYDLINIIIKNKNEFRIKFNHVSNNEIYVWVFFKKGFFSKWINLNILLVNIGYANTALINKAIEDIEIYSYISQMIEGEKRAKSKGYGIYKKKSHFIKTTTYNEISFSYIYNCIKHYVDLSKGLKLLLKKYNK